MNYTITSDSWNRGNYDAQHGRPPIFRRVGDHIEAEGDDPQADDWDANKRAEYLDGYDAYYA